MLTRKTKNDKDLRVEIPGLWDVLHNMYYQT